MHLERKELPVVHKEMQRCLWIYAKISVTVENQRIILPSDQYYDPIVFLLSLLFSLLHITPCLLDCVYLIAPQAYDYHGKMLFLGEVCVSSVCAALCCWSAGV